MNRKRLVIIGVIVVAIVLVACVISFAILRPAPDNDTALNAMSTKQALALPKDAACLSNNASVKTQVEGLPSLGEDGGIWTEEIYDLPAGTNANVSVATYDNSGSVTGSLAYPKQYGSYNFTLTKHSDGWRFTQFTRCD